VYRKCSPVISRTQHYSRRRWGHWKRQRWITLYNRGITPPEQTPEPTPNQSNDFYLWWLVPALLALGLAAAWFNHFQNGFHFDDFPTIVNNRAIRTLSRAPHFFTGARTFSDLPESSDYRPLLATSFALDYAVAGKANPAIFQMDNFVWFLLEVSLLYLLFRLIPVGTHQSSRVGAALFAFHPLAAETVNDTLRRGAIFASLG